jgi:hypothetical protein
LAAGAKPATSAGGSGFGLGGSKPGTVSEEDLASFQKLLGH